MYIPEPIDLSNHHIHRRVTHNLKCISYQGCWMIMIGHRKDGYRKAGGGIFSFFWYFCSSIIAQELCKNYVEPGKKWPKQLNLSLHICNHTNIYLQATSDPPPTWSTLPTLLTMTLAPHSHRTHLYHNLATVGLVDWQHIYPDKFFHPLIDDWFLNEESGICRRFLTDTHWWLKEVLTYSSVY